MSTAVPSVDLFTTNRSYELASALRELTVPNLSHSLYCAEGSQEPRVLPIKIDDVAARKKQFSVSRKPGVPQVVRDTGWPLLEDVELGYMVNDSFRGVIKLEYLLLTPEFCPVEAGVANPAHVGSLKEHLFGRTLSYADYDRIAEINGIMFERLHRDPVCAGRLEEFAANRRWNIEWVHQNELAFFDPTRVKPFSLLKDLGYGATDIEAAGWAEHRVHRGERRVRYMKRPGVCIPYHDPAGEIISWTTRLTAGDSKRYVTQTKNRAVNGDPSLLNPAYNDYILTNIEGELLVITEGAFKAMVASKLTDLNVIGLGGVTDYSDTTLQEVIDAKPGAILIIFDSDPIARGLTEPLGVPAARTEAYKLARAINRLGYQDVRLGTLPNARDGSKVGLDDFLLADRARGPSELYRIVARAVPPENYAREIGLNTAVAEPFFQHSTLKRALNDFQVSSFRGGPDQPSLREAASTCLSELADMRRKAIETLERPNFEGPASFLVVNKFPNGILERQQLFFTDSRGKKLVDLLGAQARQKKAQEGNIYLISLSYGSTGYPYLSGDPGNLLHYFAVPMEEIVSAVANGGELSATVRKLWEVGLRRLGRTLPAYDLSPQRFEDLCAVVIAGKLSQVFPSDDYGIYHNVRCASVSADRKFSEMLLPLVITRKSYDGVPERMIAVASPPRQEADQLRRVPLGKEFNSWLHSQAGPPK